MNTITVRHLGGDRFAITARDHTVTVDQPVSDGGTDMAPTPTELFVAGLASCVGFYVRRYLARHDLPSARLSVTASYQMAARPARVSDIQINLDLPPGVPAERHAALLAIASHCTVHNTLLDPPRVTVTLAEESAAA